MNVRVGHVVAAVVLLGLALAPAHAERNLKRPPGTTRYVAMVRQLKSLLDYDQTQGAHRMELSSLGRSVNGRDLWMVTLREAPEALTPGPSPNPGRGEEAPGEGGGETPGQVAAPEQGGASSAPAVVKCLFYLCRQHGHEPASTEGALAFITQMVKADEDAPLVQDLRHVTVYIVPMANPDGAEAFLRHNAHDKDLNRDWLRRTQPETRALYRAVMRLHPDLMTDQHELYPNDPRPDFTETAGPLSGARAGVVATCDSTQDTVQAAMQAAGFATVSHRIDDHHPARLAHRYGCVVAGVPTILFETNRLMGSGRTVADRAAAHLAFMTAVLRDLAEGPAPNLPPPAAISRAGASPAPEQTGE